MLYQYYICIYICINAIRILIIFAIRNPQDSHNHTPVSFLKAHLSATMWPWPLSDTPSKYPRCLCELIYHNFACSNSQSCPKIPLPYAGLGFHDHILMMKDIFLPSIAQHALLCHWSLSCQHLTVYGIKCLAVSWRRKVLFTAHFYIISIATLTSCLLTPCPSTSVSSIDRLLMPCSLPDFVGRMLLTLSR